MVPKIDKLAQRGTNKERKTKENQAFSERLPFYCSDGTMGRSFGTNLFFRVLGLIVLGI
jgi:hypothetical protein